MTIKNTFYLFIILTKKKRPESISIISGLFPLNDCEIEGKPVLFIGALYLFSE